MSFFAYRISISELYTRQESFSYALSMDIKHFHSNGNTTFGLFTWLVKSNMFVSHFEFGRITHRDTDITSTIKFSSNPIEELSFLIFLQVLR